jgi:hypothetical protein
MDNGFIFSFTAMTALIFNYSSPEQIHLGGDKL